jgi:hypothetical protein
MVVESTMYPTSNNDDNTNNGTVLPVKTKNYGARKYSRHDDNIDDKDKKVAAVEEGLLVSMHVITKTKTPILEMKSKRSKGTPLLVLPKLEHTSGISMYTLINCTMMLPTLEVPHLLLSLMTVKFCKK